MSIAVCHTEGCPNSGVPVHVLTEVEDPDGGEAARVDQVFCGACGREIDDVMAED